MGDSLSPRTNHLDRSHTKDLPSLSHLKSVDNPVGDTASATTLCLTLAADRLDEILIIVDMTIERPQ